MEHIHWAVPPVRFFATPFVVRHEDFRRSSMTGGLMLDRPRLTELSRKSDVTEATRTKVSDYVAGLHN